MITITNINDSWGEGVETTMDNLMVIVSVLMTIDNLMIMIIGSALIVGSALIIGSALGLIESFFKGKEK